MGVETAILAGLTAGANYNSQRSQRKASKRDQQQKQKLLDHQLSDKKLQLEEERKQRASILRARYGAANLRPNSRSATGLLQALDKRTNAEINSLQTTRQLRQPTNLLDDNYGSLVGLLRNFQSYRR